MPYINFSEDDLYRANTANLVSYLESHGQRIKRVGSTYKFIYTDGGGTHDSVTISGGKWYDHKNQRGGYAVKFLQEFLGFSFQDSVIELLGGHCDAQTVRHASREAPKPVPKPFELPEPNRDMRRVFAYLTKQRFISPDIISHFAHEHKIYEEKKYHNVVFVGTDENGVPKQASVRSTLSFGKTFRITVASSDTKYSFSHFGNDGKVFVFEAPIDMLSFITLYQKDWQQHSYIAMNGVYESAVLKALKNRPGLIEIYLCTDNDEGGIEAAERLGDILAEKGYTEIFRLAPLQKDWNEMLKQRYGAEFLPAVPHERKELYLRSVAELNEMKINPNRIANDLISVYNSADRIRLAEFSLAASEHFLKIAGVEFPLGKMKERLTNEYKSYLDKGSLSVKLGKLQSAMAAGLEQLRKPAQTAAELKLTARKLYDIADHALRLTTEETLAQRAEQKGNAREKNRAGVFSSNELLILEECMNQTRIILLCICGAFFLVIAVLAAIGNLYSLKGIPNKPVGNGQHGTARFATRGEVSRTYKQIPYTPHLWRNGKQLPSVDGLIVGCQETATGMTALVDDADIHTLMIGASGVGKTANFLYPNIEYCCAAGMSFVTTDSKGDLYRNTATIAERYYGYKVSVIDLRNPTRSTGYNMLYLVNKYMDLYKTEGKLEFKAKSEKFAKITAKTIISAGGDISNMGQNAFFYEAAEGLLTAVILLIAEFCPSEKRHIISVFKLIQDLLAPSGTKGVSRFQMLIDKLPGEHKARWFTGAALHSSDQAMASVMSTALSRLNSFIDSELEQILCFDTSIDVEDFCNHKSAIYLVLPEEDATKHFLISLIFQQLYREILTVADEKGGTLDKRVMFYMDEVGTLPKIDGLEMIFSASRSRKVSIVAIIQSLAQFEKTYGKEGAEIIVDNCQCTLFGAFAPNSKTAEEMSRNLGKQTVLSGTVTRQSGPAGGSRQLQMIERSLMTVDELKSMPKGHFIVMKTGCHPMRTRLKLFFKWGIQFEDAYSIEEKSERKVQYADCREVDAAVLEKYPPKLAEPVPVEYVEEFSRTEPCIEHSQKRTPKTRGNNRTL